MRLTFYKLTILLINNFIMKQKYWLSLVAVLFATISYAQFPTLPIAEDFELETNAISCNPTGVTIASPFFNNSTTDTDEWDVDNGGTTSLNTGPATDHNPGTAAGKYLYTETSGCNTNEANLESVFMDWTTNTSVTVEFWYHMQGASMGTMHFDIRNGNNPWQMDFVPSWTDNLNAWQLRSILVNDTNYLGANGDSVQIRIRGLTGSSFTSDMAIDDINIAQTASCPAPTGLTASNITSSSADISYVSNATNPVGFEVEWDTAGFTLGTGNTLVTPLNPYLLTGLNANTTYQVYFRNICAVGDTSAWSAPVSFTTLCAAFTPAYSTDFANYLPGCWDEADNGTIATGPTSTGTSEWTQFGTTARINLWNTGTSDWLLTPEFDLSNGPWEIAVDARVYAFSGGGTSAMDTDDTVHVAISTDNGLTWTSIYTWDVNNTPGNTTTTFAIDLSAYTGSSNLFGILGSEGATAGTPDYYFEISNFQIRTPPLCPEPITPSTTNIAADSADITWVEAGTSTQWEVEWDTAGYTQGSASNSMIINTTPSMTISGLMANTDYQWSVRSICGPNDTSTWLGPNAFKTPIMGPRSLNCITGLPSVVFSDELDAQGGWTGDIAASGNRIWRFNSGTTTSGGTGPSVSHSGTGYVYFESSSGTATTASLVSPAIDLTAGNNFAELSFWIHAFGATMGTLDVGVSTSAAGPFTNVWTNTGQLQAANGDPWQNAGVNLDAYVGQTIYLEFFYTMNGTGFTQDIAIDLVEVTTCASCSQPSNLSISNLSLTGADLNWVENGTATQWEIVWDTVGGSGTSVVSNTNPFSLSGLSGSTAYQFSVRAICSVGDTSGFAGPFFFNTPKGYPYSENFDAFTGSNPSQDGWSKTSTGNPQWLVDALGTPSSNTGPADDITGGGNYIFLETSGAAGNPDTLTSPAIVLGAADTTIEFEFNYHMFGATIGELQALVVHNGGIDTVASIVGQQQNSSTAPWTRSAHLLRGFQGQAIQLMFVGSRGSSYTGDMAIDNVALQAPPSCNDITSTSTSNITGTSAIISWVDPNSAGSYEYEYGPKGFSLGTGTLMTTSNTFDTLMNLTSSTDYDWYVRAICGAGDTSLWTAVTEFKTAFVCPAGAICATYTLGDIQSDIGFQSLPGFSTCPGSLELIIPSGNQIDSISTTYDFTATSSANAWMSEQVSYLYSPTSMLGEPTAALGAGNTAGTMSYNRNGLAFANGMTDTVMVELHAGRTFGGTACDPNINLIDSASWIVTAYYSPIPKAPISLPITWDDGATVDLTTIDFGGNVSTLVADPSNATNTVLRSIKSTTAQTWAGVSFGDSLASPIAFDPMNTILSAVVWAPASGMTIKLKAENNVNGALSVETDVLTTQAGWDTLTFDMSLHSVGSPLNFSTIYNKLSIFYNFGVNTTTDTFYVDLVEFTGGTAPPPAKAKIGLPITWEDTANVDYTVVDFGGNASMLTTDPTNASNLVMQSIKTANSQPWAGTSFGNSLDTAINFSAGNTTIRALVWVPAVGMEVRIKVEDQTNPSISVESVDTTTMIGWDTLNFDMSNQAPMTAPINFANTYDKMSIFYNFGQNPATADTFYVDYVAFENPPVIVDPYPYYPIGMINKDDSNGVPDSIGVQCRTSGTVVGVDMSGTSSSSISFTFIDQSSGSQEGMSVFWSGGQNPTYVVNEGDSIMLYGTISQFNGLTQMSPDSIVVISTGNALPTPISVSNLDATTESKLISMSSSFWTLSSAPAAGNNANVSITNGTDTLTMRIDRDTDVDDSLNTMGNSLLIGDTLCGLVGIGGQFDFSSPYTEGYQILPRRFTDLTICRNTTSIEEVNNSEQLSIYPNPTSSNFTVEYNGFSSNEVRFELRDLSGRIIKSIKLTAPKTANRIDIDMSDAADGIYFLNILDGENRIIEKIIKH